MDGSLHCFSHDGICNFKNWTDFLIGIAWPLLTAVTVFYFRKEIRDLINRITKLGSVEFQGKVDVNKEYAPSVISVLEKKILKTLWYHQNLLFSNEPNRRWTFYISKKAPEFSAFNSAVNILIAQQKVAISSENGQYYLTDVGIEYCKNHDADLGTEYYSKFTSE